LKKNVYVNALTAWGHFYHSSTGIWTGETTHTHCGLSTVRYSMRQV